MFSSPADHYHKLLSSLFLRSDSNGIKQVQNSSRWWGVWLGQVHGQGWADDEDEEDGAEHDDGVDEDGADSNDAVVEDYAEEIQKQCE